MQGLVIENINNLYKIKINEDIYLAQVRGKLRQEELPVVGDNVEFDILSEDNVKKEAIINRILERKVYIKRPKMSNITQLVLVVSSKNPKPDLMLLDKQLAFAEYLNIKPIIVLNKIDLDEKQEFNEIEKIYKNIGYKVLKTNAKQAIGIEELKKELKGNITAFSGNSGVGKSTLINALFKDILTKEGEVSERIKRGKNTTTATKIYEIDQNTYIADTPGFSTFAIDEINYKELDKYYREFVKYVVYCEFVGCTHIKEENCGIKDAVENGQIDEQRYNRFCKIYEDLKEKSKNKY